MLDEPFRGQLQRRLRVTGDLAIKHPGGDQLRGPEVRPRLALVHCSQAAPGGSVVAAVEGDDRGDIVGGPLVEQVDQHIGIGNLREGLADDRFDFVVTRQVAQRSGQMADQQVSAGVALRQPGANCSSQSTTQPSSDPTSASPSSPRAGSSWRAMRSAAAPASCSARASAASPVSPRNGEPDRISEEDLHLLHVAIRDRDDGQGLAETAGALVVQRPGQPQIADDEAVETLHQGFGHDEVTLGGRGVTAWCRPRARDRARPVGCRGSRWPSAAGRLTPDGRRRPPGPARSTCAQPGRRPRRNGCLQS